MTEGVRKTSGIAIEAKCSDNIVAGGKQLDSLR